MENKFNYTKKVLFFGMPDMGAVCLLRLVNEGVNIAGVVPPPADAPTYHQFCELAKYLKLNIIPFEHSLKDDDFLNKIKDLNADIAVVCSYSKLFPTELLNTMPNRFVNFHPSILPDYRGPNPYSHVIINAEKQTGVTIHLMDRTFDTGNMIAVRKIDIDETETMGSLFNKLNFVSADLLVEFLQRFETMDEITGVPQETGEYKIAYDISPEKGNNKINWNKDAQYIERFVRALNPFIVAIASFKGMCIKIYKVRAIDKKFNAPVGTILSVEKGLFVNTQNGAVELQILQAGSYFVGSGMDFIRQFNLQKGERFDG